MLYFSCILLGLLVGISSALLGLGGNILIVPILPLFTNIPTNEVVATGTLAVLFVTGVNSYFYLKSKLIDYKIVLSLLIPTLLMSFVGARLLKSSPENVILCSLAFVMLLMLARLNLKFKIKTNFFPKRFLILLSGVVSGFFAGLTGIGSGVILGPVLLGFNLVHHTKISPTINAMIFVACLSASFSNFSISSDGFKFGLIHLDVAFFLFLSAFFSSFLGRKINNTILKENRAKAVSILIVLLLAKIFVAKIS